MFGITMNLVIKILAYIAIVYMLTTAIYLIATRKIGTPFKDAIKNNPKLMAIKKESSKKRRKIFTIGLIVSIVVVVLFRPFKNYCKKCQHKLLLVA